ncbi:hypothetical protein EQ500_14915 [Lactobacillus sp. XV13L]|nr:hypothetical protein [Lactobacillus sp. XV13L]
MEKISDARKKANKKWGEKNKERKRYLNRRSTAKSFILKDAIEEDLDTLQEYIDQRRTELEDK